MVSWQIRKGLVKDSYLGRSRCPIVNGYFNIMISNGSPVLSMQKCCLGEKWRTILELWRHSWCLMLWVSNMSLSTGVTAVLAPSLLVTVEESKIVFCLHPTFQPLLLICLVLKAVLRYSKVCINSYTLFWNSNNPGKVICANFHYINNFDVAKISLERSISSPFGATVFITFFHWNWFLVLGAEERRKDIYIDHY